MPSKLKNLRIDRVDLVERGASMDKRTGEGAHVLLFKRDEPIQQAVLLFKRDEPIQQAEWSGPQHSSTTCRIRASP